MTWSLSEDQMGRWTERLRLVIDRLKRFSSRPAVQAAILLVVLPLFGAALVVAWTRADLDAADLAALPILAVVAAVPLAVLCSTWQLHAMTRAAGVDIQWWSALRVVTVGTLSSLLPVSSGTVIRGSAVIYWGVAPKAAAVVMAFDAVLWTSLTLVYSGAAAFLVGAAPLAIALMSGGVLLLPVVLILSRALSGDEGRLELTASRIAGIGVQVIRLVGCFLALDHSITFAEASTLAAASPLASLFFFLPGGLGVREAFTSAVAAAVGLSAATAFLAAVLNRLIGLTVLLAWEAVLRIWPTSPVEPQSQ